MTIASELFVVVVVVMLWNIIKIIVPTKIKKGNEMSLLLCEICEVNTKTYLQGKWCDDCRDDFKTSEDDK
jgi:hypothetical protein